MRTIITATLLIVTALWSERVVSPLKVFQASGYVYDIAADEKYLYAGTSRGELQIFDYKTNTLVKRVVLPKIKDFMGDEIYPKVFSVDHLNDKYLLLSEAKSGYRELYIHENNTTKKIITAEDKQTLAKAKFVDDKHIFLANLANEVMLYDLKAKREIYRFQISQSKFSDFALNLDKSKAVIGCESGEITVVDVKEGKVIQVLKGQNLDNTYKVAFRNGVVTGAGQDRRASYYMLPQGDGGYFEGSFLIYATALSPSGRYAAYAIDEENDIAIYDLTTHGRIALLKGQKSTLNTIIFLDEKRLFSASSDPKIMMWQIP
ncbi:Periplasmic nitrate reductase component NapL [hydrothermal vent metagenome]|uniref:Periplasmic nitrate reductase component NapL n=1 Tax=hydrothermal vent metagenome TaxID=652676 RepID=A0A1W1B981_9ZZZZ